MKLLTVLAVVSFSFSVMALEDLNTLKSQANSNIERKVSKLQSAKSCINNSSSVEGFKACKYDMNESMGIQKMEEVKTKRLERSIEEE